MFRSLQQRQLRGCAERIDVTSTLRDFSSINGGGGQISIDTNVTGAPPFCAAYCTEYEDQQLLALADEDGVVYVVNTGEELPQTMFYGDSEPRPRGIWEAHHNAIFDLAWIQGDEQLVTASGDHTLAVWDTALAQQRLVCRGHRGSVKCITTHSQNPHIFASGARDGSLLVWDLRTPPTAQASGGGVINPVIKIEDAHVERPPGKRGSLGSVRPVGSKRGITSAVFLHQDAVLASGSAQDDLVRFWDLRKVGGAADVIRAPYDPYPQQDPSGSRLLVSASNSVHYMHDTTRPWAGALAAYTGHIQGSFYIKTAFAPDGQHFASGSSNGSACIWAVNGPCADPIELTGHDKEVTGVAWCPSDLYNLATCSDDHTLRVWKLDRPWPQAHSADEKAAQTPRLAVSSYMLSSALSGPRQAIATPIISQSQPLNTPHALPGTTSPSGDGDNTENVPPNGPAVQCAGEGASERVQSSILDFFATPNTAAQLNDNALHPEVGTAPQLPQPVSTPAALTDPSARPSQGRPLTHQRSILDFYNAQPRSKRLCMGPPAPPHGMTNDASAAEGSQNAQPHNQQQQRVAQDVRTDDAEAIRDARIAAYEAAMDAASTASALKAARPSVSGNHMQLESPASCLTHPDSTPALPSRAAAGNPCSTSASPITAGRMEFQSPLSPVNRSLSRLRTSATNAQASHQAASRSAGQKRARVQSATQGAQGANASPWADENAQEHAEQMKGGNGVTANGTLQRKILF
ncbi:hypothetical protein WJX73_002428 [Symbiochloris irregularis]|uniref:Denticleless protein-like protein n=1 Tax=Symbiochloris irregularis TaxID=706552 RepID=A0AAW1NUW4_9CHLO